MISPLARPAPSAQPADWLSERLLPWGADAGTRVCAVVPFGFEAYARILHPACGPPPARERLRWRAIGDAVGHVVHAQTQWESLDETASERGIAPPWHENPRRGWPPPEVGRPLQDILRGFTATPDAACLAVWVGFAGLEELLTDAPRFQLPAREYALLAGPVDAAADLVAFPSWQPRGPNLWWPDDRAWCVATEIDFRWTYVGASDACIRAIENDPRLEVLRTDPEHRGDRESDWRDS